MSYKEKIGELLDKAGIQINGTHPWDVQVHNDAFYKRVFSGGSLAVGESYMDGWWDVEDGTEMIARLLRSNVAEHVKSPAALWLLIKARLFNLQSTKRAFQVGEEHYDIGNDLYEKMLDPRMTYTCGYWRHGVKTLAEAQDAKLDLVCKKIGLKKGDRVLDIGGGWGSFAKFAAEKYGAEVVAITISKEQAALGRERTKGLPIEIRVQDYRDVSDGPYDHIVSLGMFEHVGYKNYRVYMEKARELLKPDGLFLLHTIGAARTTYATDPWIDKYIFPNGMLPSVAQIGESIDRLFIMEDWHNFSKDYDTTLMAWRDNFLAAWPELSQKYDERFKRMWLYYLMAAAATFRARQSQLWQIVLSPQGVEDGYESIR